MSNSSTSSPSSSLPVRHTVLFKFKSTATSQQIASFQSAVLNLRSIPNVLYVHLSQPNNPSTLYAGYQDHSEGFEWIMDVILPNKEAFNAYKAHPERQKVIKLVMSGEVEERTVRVDTELPLNLEAFNPYKKEYLHNNPPYLHHLVLWPAKPAASPLEIQEFSAAVESLRAIPGVINLYLTPIFDRNNADVQYVMDVIFNNKESLGTYMVHEIHVNAVVKILKCVEKGIEIDFEF